MRNHRKLLIMALSLILCITASIGITFAYFTDYENARGGEILNLKGQTWIDENADKGGKSIKIKNVNELNTEDLEAVNGRLGQIETLEKTKTSIQENQLDLTEESARLEIFLPLHITKRASL